MKDIKVDIVIVGGGIAGLWAFNKLQKQGFQVALLEKNKLGAGQTICSQGIIHGGLKYALTGSSTKDSQEMAEIPSLWGRCLRADEKSELDLTATKVLAAGQYLFSTGSLATNVSSFFASKSLKSSVEAVKKSNYPELFKNSFFKGRVYKLAEIVLEVPSLLNNLAEPFKQNLIKIDSCKVNYAADGSTTSLQTTIDGNNYNMLAQHYVFLAGSGNQELIGGNAQLAKMQCRPLHMVYLKAPNLPDLYAHCMSLSANPRITITTHPANDGDTVWYMGGNLAEEGVNRSKNEQVAVAKKELATIFPWFKIIDGHWDSFRVERAEEKQSNGKKPVTATLCSYGNTHVGWPTKLAFGPLLAKNVSNIITGSGSAPLASDVDLSGFPKPIAASYPWD